MVGGNEGRRLEEWGFHCGSYGEPLAGFMESDGPLFAFWKDHLGYGVENGLVLRPGGDQKARWLIVAIYVRNNKNLE